MSGEGEPGPVHLLLPRLSRMGQVLPVPFLSWEKKTLQARAPRVGACSNLPCSSSQPLLARHSAVPWRAGSQRTCLVWGPPSFPFAFCSASWQHARWGYSREPD